MAWTVLQLLAGLLVIGMTLRDVFDTVIVPGGSHATLHIARRLVFALLPLWKRLRGRQRGLSTMFAPLVLVISFAVWMLLLALGFGLMTNALGDSFRPPVTSFGDAVFNAGTALVTIGASQSTVTGGARWVMLAAGFCGLAVMTMAVTYLLEVQTSIARRDSGIFKLRTSAGEPPAAVTLLEKYAAIGNCGELAYVLRDGRDWCATVRQSHGSHPSLIYFRTIGTGSGWPAALGTLLDLALIVELCLDAPELRGLAILLREDGSEMAKGLSELVGLDPDPAPGDEGEIEAVRGRLAAAGYALQGGFDATAFEDARRDYSGRVRAMAKHLGRAEPALIPPGR